MRGTTRALERYGCADFSALASIEITNATK